MTHNDSTGLRHWSGKGRRRTIAACVGTAAGAALTVAFASLSTAATAHADDFTSTVNDDLTTIFGHVQSAISYGNKDLMAAAMDFMDGNVPAGVNEEITGIYNIVFGPGDNIILDGAYALAGEHIPGAGVFQPLSHVPTDLTQIITDIQSDLAHSQTFFTTAVEDLFSGEIGTGVKDAIIASNDVFLNVPQAAVVGLTDILGF